MKMMTTFKPSRTKSTADTGKLPVSAFPDANDAPVALWSDATGGWQLIEGGQQSGCLGRLRIAHCHDDQNSLRKPVAEIEQGYDLNAPPQRSPAANPRRRSQSCFSELDRGGFQGK